MYTAIEIQRGESTEGNIVTRDIRFSDHEENVQFEFLPHAHHPFLNGPIAAVAPDFEQLSEVDRVVARSDLAAQFSSAELATLLTRVRALGTGIEDFVYILTETGVWWGRTLETKNRGGKNTVALIECGNQLIAQFESASENTGTPFAVIYSFCGMMMKIQDQTEPEVHAVCITQFRTAQSNRGFISRISESDLSDFFDGFSFPKQMHNCLEGSSSPKHMPAFKKSCSSRKAFQIEPLTESSELWGALPIAAFEHLLEIKGRVGSNNV